MKIKNKGEFELAHEAMELRCKEIKRLDKELKEITKKRDDIVVDFNKSKERYSILSKDIMEYLDRNLDRAMWVKGKRDKKIKSKRKKKMNVGWGNVWLRSVK